MHDQQWGLSLADLDAAIRLKPDFADAYLERGRVFRFLGQYDLAAAAYEKALSLDPVSPRMAFDFGLLDFLRGRFAAAADHFAHAAQPDGGNRYNALWLYLARARSGQLNPAESDRKAGSKVWPGPLIQLYYGKLLEDEVRKAAASKDTTLDRNQRCEADFYIGELRLVQGDQAAARQLLERAFAECPDSLIEFEMAPVELKRLASNAALVQQPSAQ
jgi:lipoprotein NlpI